MKVAALDLGTNTFLLLIAETADGVMAKVIHDEVRIVRLGQGVSEARRFHPDALIRAEEALASFGKTIKANGVTKVRACATSAARDVANGSELMEIGRKHGIPIDIISGEREAELTFAGTVSGREAAAVSIIDVGGGSTEIIFGGRQGLLSRQSFDIGSVRLTERFVTTHPVPKREMDQMTAFIKEQLQSAPAPTKSKMVIAVAGTPTTLATLDQGLPFESERVDGYVLSMERLRSWVDRLAAMTVEQRQQLAGMEPKRADVIVAGALILLLTAEFLGADNLEVSIRGLRYGIALELGSE